MLTMKLFTVLAVICCLASCAIALVPSGPSPQQAVIDGPSTFPEANLDDIEYRIHFKKGDTHPDLSCRTRTAFLRSKTNVLTETADTVHLKLLNNDVPNFPMESLLCQPATGAFNRSQYREEAFLEAKMAPGGEEKGKKMEATIGEATVFRKTDGKVSLSWQHYHSEEFPAGSVFAGKIGGGDEVYVCRFRCVSGHCQGYNFTSVNGSIIRGSIDKVLGTGWGITMMLAGPFDWLDNPRQAKVSWTPVTALSTSNGTIVSSEANGETYAIGRIFRPGTTVSSGDTLGHVDLSSKTILLSDGSIYTWENGQEKVDILMIHE